MTFDEHQRKAAREYLSAVLKRTRGNVAQAARIAGCNRTHFYKLAVRYSINYNDLRPTPRRSRYGNAQWQSMVH